MNRLQLILAIVCCTLAAAPVIADPPIRPGDRVAIVGNTFADQLRIHGYLETRLLQHTIENPVSIRNLGWGGDMLTARDRPTGFPSEESTLTTHRTDVIIACFGMGESFAGDAGRSEFKSQLEKFIASHADKRYNGRSVVRLILVSPIACEDRGSLTPERDRRNRELGAYADIMQEVATKAGVPFIDLFETSRYLMDESRGPALTVNGIHLNAYGYWAISHAFCDQLTASAGDRPRGPWSVQIDAAAQTGDGRGANVSAVAADASGVSFEVTETSAPRVGPPTDQPLPLPPQLEFARDTLVVTNLPAGTYELTIDNTAVATAAADAWADGVAIDSSPAHQSAEAYRDLVNDKNLQYTYSWKALNQVHIVGERRSSPSGRQLPKEVIEFATLADKRDAALRDGIELQTRSWRLTRVSP